MTGARMQAFVKQLGSIFVRSVLGHEILNGILLAVLFAVPAFGADPTVRPALAWQKAFGGSGNDGAMAVATDAAGNAYVAGYTNSPDFPVQNGVQMRMGGTPLRASTDGGKSWTAPAILPGVSSIAGPAAGTGLLYGFTSGGLYKSIDAGKTWTAMVSPPLGPVGSVLIDPANPSVLYVATQSGIWKAIDGGAGASWSPLLSLPQSTSQAANSIPAVLFRNPAQPTTMFASLGLLPYRSTDNGATWTELANIPYQTISMATDAIDPDTVYSATWTIGVFRSSDGGDTWTKMADQPVTYSPQAIAASPTALYLATSNGVLRSTDGGGHWSPTTITAPADAVVIDPNNSKKIYANADQFYVSTDDGSTWAPLLTIPAHSVATIAPNNAGLFIGSLVPGNIFITKWNASGDQMLWSTYLGGSYYDFPYALAVDAAGNVYVTGFTYSSDFPTSNGALQSKLAGPYNAFVAKISADGGKMLYSTLLGGSGSPDSDGDSANAIAVDSAGDAYITGYTASADFPVTPGALQAALSQGCPGPEPGGDAFVSKLGPNGDALLYSTYLGGVCADTGFGIAVDSSGSAYVAGATFSHDFPATTNPAVYTGKYNIGFLAKLKPGGGSLAYTTLLGMGLGDVAQSIAVDQQGNTYVTGSTAGLDIRQPAGVSLAYHNEGSQMPLASGGPAFVAKFSPTGTRIYATYLGSCFSTGTAIAPNSDGTAWVAGASGTAPASAGAAFVHALNAEGCFTGNVATVHPFQALGLGSGFVSELSSDGSTVSFSSLVDHESSLAIDASGNALVSGGTPVNGKWSPSLWKIDGSVPSPVTIEAPQSDAMTPHLVGFYPAVVAPGAVLVIPGAGLGPDQPLGSQITPGGTLATTLGGTSITFDGIPAPLVSVQAQQIVCLAPFELAGRTTTTVQVSANGSLSNAIRVPVTPTAAAILAVVNQDGTPNSKDSPAAPGSVMTVYLSGLGLANPPVPDGTINGPGSPMPVAPISARINGWLAPNIQYAGPAPGEPAGIVQVNFQIPSTIPGQGPWPAPPNDQYTLVAGTGSEATTDNDIAPLWIK